MRVDKKEKVVAEREECEDMARDMLKLIKDVK